MRTFREINAQAINFFEPQDCSARSAKLFVVEGSEYSSAVSPEPGLLWLAPVGANRCVPASVSSRDGFGVKCVEQLLVLCSLVGKSCGHAV